MAPHRDAFLWGAVAADVDQASGANFLGRERTHAPATEHMLFERAVSSHERGAQAFALGWASHIAADQSLGGLVAAFGADKARMNALKGAGPAWPDAILQPLLEWTMDAALLGQGGSTLRAVGRAAALHTGTPAQAPIQALLDAVLGVDEPITRGWAGLLIMQGFGGPDRYLESRARFLRITEWADAAREPAGRAALGDVRPWVTEAVNGSVARVRALLHPMQPGQSPVFRSTHQGGYTTSMSQFMEVVNGQGAPEDR